MDSGTSQTQTIHGCKIIDAAPSSGIWQHFPLEVATLTPSLSELCLI